MLTGEFCPRALAEVKKKETKHIQCNVAGSTDLCSGNVCEEDSNCFSGCCSIIATGDRLETKVKKLCMPTFKDGLCPLLIDDMDEAFFYEDKTTYDVKEYFDPDGEDDDDEDSWNDPFTDYIIHEYEYGMETTPSKATDSFKPDFHSIPREKWTPKLHIPEPKATKSKDVLEQKDEVISYLKDPPVSLKDRLVVPDKDDPRLRIPIGKT